MDRLPDVTVDKLHRLLEGTDDSVPPQRILTAIAYKQGDSIQRLAERHGVSQQTIRNWLDRFEAKPLDEAPVDEARSGRPSKLSTAERDRFFADLESSPEAFGYDRQEWDPKLAHKHLDSAYDVDYSVRHVRRLMHEAGIYW